APGARGGSPAPHGARQAGGLRARSQEGDVEIEMQVGNPFRRILEEARDWPADLVVMAVSDERGVRSPYVGSVTQQVLEFASCPVLVVPGRQPRDGRAVKA